MVASVAVLSDIHAVLPALDAVLADPDVRDAELILLTGDTPPDPSRPRRSTGCSASATGSPGCAATRTGNS